MIGGVEYPALEQVGECAIAKNESPTVCTPQSAGWMADLSEPPAVPALGGPRALALQEI
jgi:hypothetical protein